MKKQLLERVSVPEDIKSLSIEDLTNLSNEIRDQIIKVMSVNGGHLASNLGSIELTIALHYTLSSPTDKFVFDTSHQTYAHKILTDRKDLFSTIRKFKGLSGFANPDESPHDLFFSGHAGTGLSQAMGLAKNRDLDGSAEHIVAVVADAPLACGHTFEALNNLQKDTKNFIIILNDNAMAISNGVGNVHNRILGSFVIPRKTKPEAKAFFEKFGIAYRGPIDGHDVRSMIDAINDAKNHDGPILIHALTIKGNGMPTAMENPITYHGVKPFDPESGKFHPTPSSKSTFPKVFGKHLLDLADKDPSVIAITPAMPQGSCLDKFMKKHPDRCLDVGIAEGHAVSFAGALALKGTKKVVTAVYSSFFHRAFDNLFQDVCLQRSPAVFALDRGGFSPGDGTTHHGIYDISFMNAMPNMVIAQPRDGDLLKDLLDSSFTWKKPTAIRYPNMPTEESDRPRISRPLGKGEILVQGRELAILALGHMDKMAFDVREILMDHGIRATIVDPIFIKPLDSLLLYQLMLEHHYFVTIEEHCVTSGFGAIVNSFMMKSGTSGIVVQNFGIPDQFIEHGSYNELMDQVGLNPQVIADQILNSFAQKQPDLDQASR